MVPVDFPRSRLEVIIAHAETDLDEAGFKSIEDAAPVIEKAYNRGVEFGLRDLKEAGFIFDIPPDPHDLEFLRDYNFDLIKGLTEDLKKEVKRVIRDGILNGKGVPKISKDLRDALKRKEARINTIARTETMRASNFGRIRTYEKSGVVKYKEWLTAFDDKTCSICADLDGERVPLDRGFSIGVYAPPAHPNCRCTIIPIIEKGALKAVLQNEDDEDERDKIRRTKEIYSRTLEREYSRLLKRHFKEAIRDIIDFIEIEMAGV